MFWSGRVFRPWGIRFGHQGYMLTVSVLHRYLNPTAEKDKIM